MLKLKLQYFGHLMQRTDSFEKILMLGNIEDGRRRGRQRMRWLDGSPTRWILVWASPGICWWTGSAAVHGVAKSWTWLSDWTELSPVIWNRKSSPVFSSSSRLAMRKKRRLVTTFLRWVTVSSLQSESSGLFSAPSVKTANVSLPLRAWELWLKLSCLSFNFISD